MDCGIGNSSKPLIPQPPNSPSNDSIPQSLNPITQLPDYPITRSLIEYGLPSRPPRLSGRNLSRRDLPRRDLAWRPDLSGLAARLRRRHHHAWNGDAAERRGRSRRIVRRRDLLLLVGSAVIAMFVVTISSESWSVFIDGFRLWFDNVRDTVRGWF